MKKLYSLLISLCIIVISTFTAGAINESEIRKLPIKYRFDLDTRTLTEAKTLSNAQSSKSTSENSVNLDEALPEYNPKGDSLPPSEYSPNAILGSWKEINPATGGQYRNTVYINITTKNGSFRGSGFMIGPSAVATAAHVIYNNEFGGDNFATSATITPAKANNSSPYGTAKAKTFVVYDEWTDKHNAEYDWAIIELDSNIGDKVGHLGLRWQSASYNGQSIPMNGYPKYLSSTDKTEHFTMYSSSGTIYHSSTRLLWSKDTNTYGGISGGPTYFYSSNTGYTAIGITTGQAKLNGVLSNMIVRITEEVYNEFAAYRNVRV